MTSRQAKAALAGDQGGKRESRLAVGAFAPIHRSTEETVPKLLANGLTELLLELLSAEVERCADNLSPEARHHVDSLIVEAGRALSREVPS